MEQQFPCCCRRVERPLVEQAVPLQPMGPTAEQISTLFSSEQSRLRGGLMAACSSLMRGAEGQVLCSALLSGDSDRTQGNGMELGQGRVRMDFRKRFFTGRVVGY